MSFTASRRERMPPTIPLASMIDIMFLLLTFFLAAATFREYERQIAVSLATSRTAAAGAGSHTSIVITIQEDGTVFLGDLPYTIEGLQPKLVQLAREFPNESVIIRADQTSQVGTTVKVMDMARLAGLQNIGLSTVKPESEVGQ
jgi:biopolymer transport protein ExbD